LFHSVDEAVSGIVYPEANDRAKVCTPVDVAVVIPKTSPVADVDVAKDCEDDVLLFSCVIPPPAPASPPQANVPFAQVSLPDDGSQLVSPAPKRLAREREPVEVALLKKSDVVVALVAVRREKLPDAVVRSVIVVVAN
jgi:hypothetical protein